MQENKRANGQSPRVVRLAGFGLVVASAFALAMMGGCRKLVMGADPMRATAASVSNSQTWTISVAPSSKRSIDNLGPSPTQLTFNSTGSGTEALSIFVNANDYSNATSGTVVGQDDGAEYDTSTISGTTFDLVNGEVTLSGADITVVKKKGTSTVVGIYGTAGGLSLTKIGFSLPGLAHFWFAKGSIINSILKDAGAATLPILDGTSGAPDRTYAVFMPGLATIKVDLISLPTIPAPCVAIVDPYDPSFYWAKYALWDAAKGLINKLKSKSQDQTESGTPPKTGDAETEKAKDKSKLDFDIRALSLSWQGLTPIRRKVLWPFNADINGVVFTNDYGDLMSLADIRAANPTATIPDDYSPWDGITIKTHTGTKTYKFNYGDQDPRPYGSGDTVDDGIPIVGLSNLYIDGKVDLKEMTGLPLSLEGGFGLAYDNSWVPTYPSGDNPPAQGSAAFNQTYKDVYARLVANASLTMNLSLDKYPKLSKFLQSPEIGDGSALINIGPDRSYAYVSLQTEGKKSLADVIHLNYLPFASKYFEPVLSQMIVSDPGDYKLALYFDSKDDGSDLSWMFRVHGNYEYKPGAIIDYAVSQIVGHDMTIFGAGLGIKADIAVGTDGFFLNGTVNAGFSLPLGPDLALTINGSSDLSAWVVDQDNWGFHFDITDLGINLPLGLGNFDIDTAEIEFTSQDIYVAGSFNFGLASLFSSSGSASGLITYNPSYLNLNGALDVTLLGFMSASLNASIDSNEGISLSGSLDLDPLGSIAVSGTCKPAANIADASFSLTGKADLNPGGVKLASMSVSVSNKGAFASGTLQIPHVSDVEVTGAISSSGFDFKGYSDLTIAGYKLTGVNVDFSNTGIALDGTIQVPDFMTTRLTGYVNFQTGAILLTGTGDVTVGSYHLVSAAVSFSGNLGINGASPSVSITVQSRVTLDPLAAIAVNGNFQASASSISGYLSGTANVQGGVSAGFSVCGFDLEFALAASASLTATVNFSLDLNTAAMTVSVSVAGSATASVTFPWVEVTWKKACASLGFLGSICIYYPDFSWTNETISVGANISGGIGTDGIDASFQLTGLLDFIPEFSIKLK